MCTTSCHTSVSVTDWYTSYSACQSVLVSVKHSFMAYYSIGLYECNKRDYRIRSTVFLNTEPCFTFELLPWHAYACLWCMHAVSSTALSWHIVNASHLPGRWNYGSWCDTQYPCRYTLAASRYQGCESNIAVALWSADRSSDAECFAKSYAQ